MNIQLKWWKVKELSLQIKDNDIEGEEKKSPFDMSIGHFFSKDNSREFGIGFEIKIEEEEFTLFIEIAFLFELDEDINEEFKKSDFIKINAPAIAFPYVRSYISNLTLQSGFLPIMLPSINFVRIAQRNIEQ